MFKRKTFPGGIHPPHNKKQTEKEHIQPFPTPQTVTILMSMHVGLPAKVIVKKGDHVRAGECVGESGAGLSVPVFSSICGTVTAVGNFAHPTGRMSPGVEITADDQQDEFRFPPLPQWNEIASQELIQRIHDCGIVGMGGAAFPTHVKLSPPVDKKIDTLIINGAECEPYLTEDHRSILEYSADLLSGTKILQRILDVNRVVIAIEKNKPDAIRHLERLIQEKSKYSSIEIASLETKYPQGGEKQLIYAVTKREVPNRKLPMDAECVVQNIGTAIAVHNAIVNGITLHKRVVTVTGPLVKRPGNFMVPIGTSVREILTYCGTDFNRMKKVIMGGPMMGTTLSSLDVPILKSTSGLLTLDTVTEATQEHNCINCGACVTACPIRLIPSHMSKYVSKDLYAEAEKIDIMSCVECGSCSYVCPAKINLLHTLRLGKNRIVAARNKSGLK